MPEAADTDNEIKRVGAPDNDDQMQRKGRSKHVKYLKVYEISLTKILT